VNRQFKDWLRAKNVQFTELETPGVGHVWPYWRQNFTELATEAFQKQQGWSRRSSP
jgi:enterochelin esterase-like enzyme